MSIWIIEESPNPGIWNVLQSRGMYKNKARADKKQDWWLKAVYAAQLRKEKPNV